MTEVSDENGGRKYSWGVLSGTSMATPVVTGTVALWLQADNTLTVDDVLDVIQATAVRDVYTGGEVSGVFGHGKIDARAGLEYLVRSTGISSNALAGVKCTYNNGKLIVSSSPGVSRVALYRIDGTLVSTVEVHGGEAVIDVPRRGVYLVKMITDSGKQTLKLAL